MQACRITSSPSPPFRWRSRADGWVCLPSGLMPRALAGWASPRQHQQKKKAWCYCPLEIVSVDTFYLQIVQKNSETVGRDCERQDGVHQWHHWIKIMATQACIFSLFRPCRSQWSLYCRSVAGDLKLLTICFGYADQQEPKPMIMNKFHTTSTRWHWKIQLMCYSSTFTFFKTRPLKIRTQGDRAIAPESTKDVKKKLSCRLIVWIYCWTL